MHRAFETAGLLPPELPPPEGTTGVTSESFIQRLRSLFHVYPSGHVVVSTVGVTSDVGSDVESDFVVASGSQ
jgi:hypothetical protein